MITSTEEMARLYEDSRQEWAAIERRLDATDHAMQRNGGRPPKTFNNVQGLGAPVGNSRAAALRHLRSQRPDLHTSHGLAWVWFAVLAGHFLGVLTIAAWLLR